MTDYLLILVSTILVNNFVLVQFLGLCPFMGVSNKLETAIGMSAATWVGIFAHYQFYYGDRGSGWLYWNGHSQDQPIIVSRAGYFLTTDYDQLCGIRCRVIEH